MENSNITYKNIEQANKTIKTTNIKGKEYAEVNQRIRAFRMLYPEGTITSEIISLENGVCVMKASVLNGKGEVLATGHACEKESASFINKTSYIENCETSAVGRALGMCGIGIDMSIASYEEVANAIAQQNTPSNARKPAQKAQASNKQEFICKQCGQPVKAAEGHSADKIVANTMSQFGMVLCMDCAHKAQEQKDAQEQVDVTKIAEEVTADLPFLID